ncbi:hypothetical protein L210DRAFT_934093 [Boletus edulis BED1]|uniref:Uncharacterized protein n=1 Tax=Boletus edulis BED1 TaxID=1328754 RepID=A0AAD4BIJ1_BOLED|nr:hypothetical protein L210DRAFT_934093 [Boletus edulis BED1]
MTDKAKAALAEQLTTVLRKRKEASEHRMDDSDVKLEQASIAAKKPRIMTAALEKRQDSQQATVRTEEEKAALQKDTIVINSDDKAPKRTNKNLDTGKSAHGSKDKPEGAKDELSKFYLPDKFY